ncbi:MAG: hypothetical protein NZM26_02325, partial [Patescibacteria group bacterium]|nr:hypothetical protein [Patescibacteria group bacterium]
HNLSGWDYLIHKNEVPKMVMLRGIINKVNELVVSELNEGVTTVTVAVVSHELVNGRKQIFLDIAWVGDSQVMLLGFDNENNSYFVEKLVIPHDCLYGLILNKLELEDDIGMKCSQTSLLQARKDALNKLQEICVPYKPDIFAHLGEHKGKTGLVRISTRTINISQEYLSSGKNGLKLVVCSDNLGDKVPEDIIRESYLQHFNDNSAFATSLGRYMANQDLDDGCMVVADLGFNSGN